MTFLIELLRNFILIEDYVFFGDDEIDLGWMPWIISWGPYISIYWLGLELIIRWRQNTIDENEEMR